MSYLNERVSYLRGLAEGLGIDESTDQGKVLVTIIDILDDIVDSITELEASQAELDDYVETIDEDLSDIEEQMYGDAMDEYDDDPRYIEVECPNCHETVLFDEDAFENEDDLQCPDCHEKVYVDEEKDE